MVFTSYELDLIEHNIKYGYYQRSKHLIIESLRLNGYSNVINKIEEQADELNLISDRSERIVALMLIVHNYFQMFERREE
jgi:hypothetical protein